MGRANFDFDVISGPAPPRTPPEQPAPTKPASDGNGTPGAAPPADTGATAK